jgi:glutamate-1-semialdehyde 2,1-aminomutase
VNILRSEKTSRKDFARAQRFLVGGVNSPVRSFSGVERSNPLFIASARGSKLRDVDGNEYIDYISSWGASILGSADPDVEKAVSRAAKKGLSYGAATNQETDLAERIQKSVPSMELMRFVCSGTEATMSAIRVARAFTKRNKTIKFEGCYHGHADSFLVKSGSGLATFSIASSSGVPKSVASETLVARFNDLDSVNSVFLANRNEVAAVIVEPVAGNMGVIPPKPEFLSELKKAAQENGALLIFDEVITGFRIARGGAQAVYGVKPDMTCLGKIIGGGMNIAAYGGRREIMELVSPLGPVYQAGTLAGNPIAVAAGIATLDKLNQSTYRKLEATSSRLENGLKSAAMQSRVNLVIQRVGSMLGLFFNAPDSGVLNYDDVAKCDRKMYIAFFNRMLDLGIYLPPSSFETVFVSTSHSRLDVEKTILRAQQSFESTQH